MQWFDKLKFARKVKDLSLQQLSEISKISEPYLSQLENGQIKNPSFFKIAFLLRFYNIDLKDFIGEDSKIHNSSRVSDCPNVFPESLL